MGYWLKGHEGERDNYFGGALSKGFARLRNVSKLTFFDKIGHVKSVGFRFYSAIWRSMSRICSRYLEITSISLIYSLTFSRKKELLFRLSRGLNPLTCVTRQIRADSQVEGLANCATATQGSWIWKIIMKWYTAFGTRLGVQVLVFSACFGYFTKFLHLEGRLKGGFLAERVSCAYIWRAYTWRDLFSEFYGREEINLCRSPTLWKPSSFDHKCGRRLHQNRFRLMWNTRALSRLHAGNFWAHCCFRANRFNKLCRTWLKR